MQSRRPGRHRDAMLGAGAGRDRLFEFGNLGPLGQPVAPQHFDNSGDVVLIQALFGIGYKIIDRGCALKRPQIIANS